MNVIYYGSKITTQAEKDADIDSKEAAAVAAVTVGCIVPIG